MLFSRKFDLSEYVKKVCDEYKRRIRRFGNTQSNPNNKSEGNPKKKPSISSKKSKNSQQSIKSRSEKSISNKEIKKTRKRRGHNKKLRRTKTRRSRFEDRSKSRHRRSPERSKSQHQKKTRRKKLGRPPKRSLSTSSESLRSTSSDSADDTPPEKRTRSDTSSEPSQSREVTYRTLLGSKRVQVEPAEEMGIIFLLWPALKIPLLKI